MSTYLKISDAVMEGFARHMAEVMSQSRGGHPLDQDSPEEQARLVASMKALIIEYLNGDSPIEREWVEDRLSRYANDHRERFQIQETLGLFNPHPHQPH